MPPSKVTNHSTPPPGALPKNIQGILIFAIAALIILSSLWSSWRSQKKPAQQTRASLAEPGADTRQIQEFRKKLEAENARLAEEAKRLSKPTLPAPPVYVEPQVQRPVEVDPFLRARRRREFEAPFASNFSFIRREEAKGTQGEATAGVRETNDPGGRRNPGDEVTEARESGKRLPPVQGALYRLYEGTVIDAVLLNRLDGTFSGPVQCVVSTPVYAGHVLVVPAGAKLLGEARRVDAAGQRRLSVAFHRLLLPDGYSVDLERVPGLEQGGETGLKDKVNNHYVQVFGVSALLGVFAGLSLRGTRYGLDNSTGDLYREGVASSLGNSATRILDRYLNILPTVTIREGHVMKAYLTRDLLLPEFRQ